MKPKLDTQEEGRDDALSDVLKSCNVSDLLNSLFVPSHKTLLQPFGKPEAKRLFFSPVEWHKNIRQLMLYTYGLHFFSVGKYHYIST